MRTSYIVVTAASLLGCGPTELQLQPKDVVDVQVRPASGQALFCPGDRFQVELVAKLRDGTTCSNVDPNRGCMGKKDSIIDPSQVHLEGSPGALDPKKFIMHPPEDPLGTAEKGIDLRGWLKSETERSMEGTQKVAPVYDCQRDYVLVMPPPVNAGENGGAGQEVLVAVTTLSTPWFPNAALIRVEIGSTRFYRISPSADRPVRIVAPGQPGAAGATGEAGTPGADGQSATEGAVCTPGGDGLPGTSGGRGGNGGNGGAGGKFRLVLDDAKSEALLGRVVLENPGGAGGRAGPGGPGGAGGKGGAGAQSAPACPGVVPAGKDGATGATGLAGAPGQPGPAGPPPDVTTTARATLFAAELASISSIEAAPRAAK